MLKDSKTDMGFLTIFSKTYPSLLLLIKLAALGNLKASFHCAHLHSFFPLRKAPPLFSVFFNSLYDPFGFPLVGDRNLRGKEETAPPSLLTASL